MSCTILVEKEKVMPRKNGWRPVTCNTGDMFDGIRTSFRDIIGDVMCSGIVKCNTPDEKYAVRIQTGCYRILPERIDY